MGGPGSGRQYWWEAKDTVEDCRTIDVTRWHREDMLHPGCAFTWAWWRDADRTASAASIGVRVLPDGAAGTAAPAYPAAVVLHYTITPAGGGGERVEYRVPLTWTPCHFGGQRPWFVCPGVIAGQPCGRRVGKLYLHGRYFLCRHCHRLAYTSTREAPHTRAVTRAQRIRRRLGGSANMLMPFPDKPKGMHWRTYRRLHEAHDRADLQATISLAAWLERADRRIERLARWRERGPRRVQR